MSLAVRQIFGNTTRRTEVRDGTVIFIKEKKLLGNIDKTIINEAHLIEKLRHRNLIHYINHSIHGQILRIEMEYCHGGSLQSYLQFVEGNGHYLQAGTIVKLALEMLDGLQYLHTLGYVHRSICPSNILLTIDLVAVLSNFSTSRLSCSFMNAEFTQSSYTPTDQYQVGYDSSVDIFSLGCVWYELISLKPLFTIDSISRKIEQSYLLPSELAPFLGADFIDIIREMTNFDPKKRIKISDLQKTKFVEEYRKNQTDLLMLPLFVEPCQAMFADNGYKYSIKNYDDAPPV